MASAVQIQTDFRGIEAHWEGIQKAAEAHVRPAAQAGIQLIYDQARLLCPVFDGAGHWFYGRNQRYWFAQFTLRNSIYQVYSKDHSNHQRAEYHTSWNFQKAPYGHMVEFGPHSRPFLRPAYYSTYQIAMQTTLKMLQEGVGKAL